MKSCSHVTATENPNGIIECNLQKYQRERKRAIEEKVARNIVKVKAKVCSQVAAREDLMEKIGE